MMEPTLRTKFMKHKVNTRKWGVETDANKTALLCGEHQEAIAEGRKW